MPISSHDSQHPSLPILGGEPNSVWLLCQGGLAVVGPLHPAFGQSCLRPHHMWVPQFCLGQCCVVSRLHWWNYVCLQNRLILLSKMLKSAIASRLGETNEGKVTLAHPPIHLRLHLWSGWRTWWLISPLLFSQSEVSEKSRIFCLISHKICKSRANMLKSSWNFDGKANKVFNP